MVFWAPIRAFRSKSSAKTAVGATADKELLPSLLSAGTNWRFSLRAFRCNRGRGRIVARTRGSLIDFWGWGY
ncbi:MAG: hypothetical protein EA358_01730 [Flavobacteriales bacterium]|nr:MAG: hypothetical protein EA358_01730 [Flavobacteriales bacterium]